MTLERVIGNATLPDQVTAPVGVFIAPGDGSSYDWIPATDISGAPVTVSLNGKSTLRLTKVSGDTRLNYLMFVAMETSAAAPSVVITAPVDGAAFVPGADVSITADASDSDGQVARVEFFAETAEGRQSVGVDTQAPYGIIVPNVPEANYILTAEATDNDGMISRSSAIAVFVDATPPSVISVVGKQSLTAVLIQFSEVLRADTATNIANYSVSSANGAIAVTEAELSADGTTVTLITDLQITGHQSAFQIKPQKHVQIVLQLVGLGPDIAVRDTVDDAVEGFFIRHAKITEGIAHLTIQPAGKGTAAPKLVFIDPALAFMHAHGHTTTQRRQQMHAVDVLLIGPMPDLVNGGVDAVERIKDGTISGYVYDPKQARLVSVS